MLPDERMVEAARDAGDNLGVELTRDVILAMLKCAFVALDRDALIEEAALGVADVENWPHGKPNPTEREREFARRALKAVGLIQ